MKDMLTVLHPALETEPAPKTKPRLATRLASLQGKKLALLDNGKVNAGAVLTAIGKRLKDKHGLAEVRTWKKRHAGETGAGIIPDLMKWRPDLALTALGD
jgi:hypothetical protein